MMYDYFHYFDYPDYSNYCTYLCRFVTSYRPGHPGTNLANKRRMLAKTVDDLGERFRPTLQAAWLALSRNHIQLISQSRRQQALPSFVDDDE